MNIFKRKEGMYRAKCISSRYFINENRFEVVFSIFTSDKLTGESFLLNYPDTRMWVLIKDLQKLGLPAPNGYQDLEGWLKIAKWFKDRELNMYFSYYKPGKGAWQFV